MGRGDLTTHGFRSTFRDWAAEATAFPAEVAEMALAHVVGDKVEAAYRRGDLFQKRRQLAEAWATYCDSPAPRRKSCQSAHSARKNKNCRISARPGLQPERSFLPDGAAAPIARQGRACVGGRQPG